MLKSTSVDKQIVVNSYSEMVLSNKKEYTTDIYNSNTCNMDESKNMLSKKKSQETKIMIMLTV